MERIAISTPHFHALKVWVPMVNTLFLIGVGAWWFLTSPGILLMDVLVAGAWLVAIVQILWTAVVLKHVELEGDDIVVSDLEGSVRIAKADVLEIRHHPKRKPRFPSVLVVRGPAGEPRMIRFIPAAPREESVDRLRAFVAG